MIDHLEPDPESAKARLVDDEFLGKVAIGRIDVDGFTAKVGKID